MKSSEIINKLKSDGWILERIRGSHHIFTKEGFLRPVAVPHPKKDLPIGTVRAIEKQSGVKLLR